MNERTKEKIKEEIRRQGRKSKKSRRRREERIEGRDKGGGRQHHRRLRSLGTIKKRWETRIKNKKIKRWG